MTATSHDHGTRMLSAVGIRRRRFVPAIIAVAALCALPALADRDDRGDARWTGTWSAAMQTPLAPAATFDNVTMRELRSRAASAGAARGSSAAASTARSSRPGTCRGRRSR